MSFHGMLLRTERGAWHSVARISSIFVDNKDFKQIFIDLENWSTGHSLFCLPFGFRGFAGRDDRTIERTVCLWIAGMAGSLERCPS
jgi:hypothetical protein